jgi:hypothetical protein
MIERVLELGSTETPACQCGVDMELIATESRSFDTRLKIFRCPDCQHEMRLMVWSEPPATELQAAAL